MDKHDLKLEQAKSWFVLAQLSMILAGFLFASSGIMMTNAQNTLFVSRNHFFDTVSLINFQITNAESLKSYNLSKDYFQLTDQLMNTTGSMHDLVVAEKNYATFSFFSALVLTIFSIMSFFFGKFQISKINITFPNNPF